MYITTVVICSVSLHPIYGVWEELCCGRSRFRCTRCIGGGGLRRRAGATAVQGMLCGPTPFVFVFLLLLLLLLICDPLSAQVIFAHLPPRFMTLLFFFLAGSFLLLP